MKRQSPPCLRQHRITTREATERGQTTRTLAIVVLGLVLSTCALQGQDGSRYRDLKLGGDLPPVLTAVIQELEWRPPYFVSGSPAPPRDPIQQIVFTFSNDQVSKMVVDSDRDQVKNARTVTSQVKDEGILPWGLRRAGAGIRLTVSGVDISIQRNGFKLSKSVTF